MAPLIDKDDYKVMKNTKFVKNAVFYKDMFAFYDAYTLILNSEKTKLPNYCFLLNGNYCLEGICLLMSDYASELGFESLKLSLDYLKTIYYTIASFSDDENLPEKSVIEEEFEMYKKASEELAKAEQAKFEEKLSAFNEVKKDFDKTSNQYAKKLVSSRILSGLSVVLLIVFFAVGMFPFAFYYFEKLSFTLACVLGGVSVIIAFTLYFSLKKLSEKLEGDAGGLLYVIQNKKKAKNQALEVLNNFKLKYAKIENERYEYNNSFSKALSKFVEHLSFDEVLKKASEYKLLSYNIKLDVKTLFVNQRREVEEMVSKIENTKRIEDYQTHLLECYKQIKNKDWLYFNNEVRLAFIKNFTESSEKTFNWRLEFAGEKINPFGINIKAMAKEQVTFLSSDDSLFISASIDKLLRNNYIKNLKWLKLKNLNNVDAIKMAKVEFSSHFFDYEKTKMYDNLFYDKKLGDNKKVPEEITRKTKKIPTLILGILKLQERYVSAENCDYEIISRIMSDVSEKEYDASDKKDMIIIDETTIHYPDFECDSIESFEDYIKYNIGGNNFVGYKFT